MLSGKVAWSTYEFGHIPEAAAVCQEIMEKYPDSRHSGEPSDLLDQIRRVGAPSE